MLFLPTHFPTITIQDTQIRFLDDPSDSPCHAAAFHQTIAVPQWLGVAGFTGYVNYAR
jgi:hypothetical protein